MRPFLFLIFCCFIVACTSDPGADWSDRDLTGHGVAITIKAPDSARIESKTVSSVMRDVKIESPADKYAVQVLGFRATTNDMARLKAEQLDLVRDNRYFERIITEEPNGFLFENLVDSIQFYGFRYIVYQGDQEFVFQNGMNGRFTLEEAEAMYRAVKQEK